MNYKIDLHTHSILSHDGGITLNDYKAILDNNIVDYVAITDHNEIDFALAANKKLGEKVIVGEEIKTSEGEIIGLFLKKQIKKNQSLQKTIHEIKNQGGIVYVPHPFDYKRHCVGKKGLSKIADSIDIVEIFNARSVVPPANRLAEKYASRNNFAFAASTDAHSVSETGNTYTLISQKPNKNNISKLLLKPKTASRSVGIVGFFNPKINKLKKLLNSNNGNGY